MLAAVDFESPLVWAVLIGWIMSVVLHEFAHGLVGWLGGDYTIRERGGLSLNPFQYVDPVTSILMPAVLLMLGGIPLPGGVNYIRRDLLRSRGWESAVSLAGPAMNFLLFLACALPLHPKFGWADYSAPEHWTDGQAFLATIAILQFLAMTFNLVPVPPLDGFQAISPFMDRESQIKLSTPPISTFLFIMYFMIVWQVPAVMIGMLRMMERLMVRLGFGHDGFEAFLTSYFNVLRS